jgi:hypothetical protein
MRARVGWDILATMLRRSRRSFQMHKLTQLTALAAFVAFGVAGPGAVFTEAWTDFRWGG